MESFGEAFVDGVEGVFEFFLGGGIELGDSLLRVLNGFQQIIALAGEESEALVALVEFLEGHHVYGAHGVDALFHFAVADFGGGQFFAAHEGRLGGEEVFGLGVYFCHAGFTQMLAIGIVAGASDLRVVALFAQFLQRLAAHAQMIFHLSHAIAPAVPFLFHFALARFEAQLFGAQAVQL